MTRLLFLTVFVKIFGATKKTGLKNRLRKLLVKVCHRHWLGLSIFLWPSCWFSPRSMCWVVAPLASSLSFWGLVLSLVPILPFVLPRRFSLQLLAIFRKRIHNLVLLHSDDVPGWCVDFAM